MKTFKIDVAVYHRKIICCVGGNSDKVWKVLKKKVSKKVERTNLSDCDGYTMMFRGGTVLIWLAKAPNNPYKMGILSHEISHSVDYLLSYIGVTRDNDANEAHAYLTGYITEQFYKKI